MTLLMLASCQSDGPMAVFEPESKTKTALIAAECDIYHAIELRLASENRNANGDITDGCPAVSGEISADIAPHNPPRQIDSKYAGTLYQRMIARGVPKDIADDVRKSNAFFDLVQDTDTVYLRR